MQPDWAAPPDLPGDWHHNDNYSALEVVWSTLDGGCVIQTPAGHFAPGSVDRPPPWGSAANQDPLAEARGWGRAALDLAEKHDRNIFGRGGVALFAAEVGMKAARKPSKRWVAFVASAATVGGAVGGWLGVHFLPWH